LTRCALNSTTWHRCRAEGLRFVLGPMSVPGRTVSYADTRGRLFAAADLPDEPAAHWAYLDGDTLPPVPWPGTAATAVLAGLLVEDVLRRQEAGTPAGHDVQLVPEAHLEEIAFNASVDARPGSQPLRQPQPGPLSPFPSVDGAGPPRPPEPQGPW
jgi:hypothetical protein